MSAEGWLFMVGFRVFDVGLLVLWLVWFFRLRDDPDPPDEEGEDDHGGGPPLDPPDPSGDGGLALPLGVVSQGRRVRDHSDRRQRRHRREAEPIRPRSPSRCENQARRGRRKPPVPCTSATEGAA